MIEKIIQYLEKNKVISEKEIKKKFNLTDEDWKLILVQLRDLGYIEEKLSTSPCTSCSFSKFCSQVCLISEPLSPELQKKE